ncbi:MAG: response regulator [Magnetococcales bacterium]|nr:response regulator [Magnetococcales bacterium]
MKLSAKLLLIALLVAGLFIGFSGIVQRYVIYPSFEELDDQEARENGQRSVSAMQRELHHLGLMVRDWSFWDDTYRFMEERNPEYYTSNLTPEVFANLHADLLFFYDSAGGVVWGHTVDPEKKLRPWPDFPASRPDHPLRKHADLAAGNLGILLTPQGPMLVAAFPILTSDRRGPARGTLIMGRFLEENLLKTLREQTGVVFHLWEAGRELTSREVDIRAELARLPVGAHLLRVEGEVSYDYALLPDVESRAALLLRSDTKRAHSDLGGQAIVTGMFFQFGSAMLTLAVMMIFLRKVVIAPIRALTCGVKQGDLSLLDALPDVAPRDEIDILGHYKVALEKAVVERTRDLQEARDVAVGAARAKGEFLATMSHEIRTPMNVIIGYSEILEERAVLSAEERQYLGAIKHAGNSLLCLINDILDLAKVESGRLMVERVPFGLRELMGACVAMFSGAAKVKGLELHGFVDAGIPDRLLGDQVRVRQVLVNLLGNAVKFTPKGRVSLRVREEVRSDRVVVLTCAVEDTGIGVPEEKLQTIFDAFTQADSGDTRRFGGSGLGLAICVRLAEAMGGVVWAESPGVGQGSRFYCTLPFLMDPSERTIPLVGSDQTREWSVRVGQPAGPLSILVVDDAEENRILLQTILTQAGHRVVLAENGRLAVDRVSGGERPDLIIMDIQMPVMDGYEATRALRALEIARGSKPLPIIAFTAHAMAGERERCLEAGCDLFLTKPIKKDRLLGEIHGLMSRGPGLGRC